MQKYLDKSGDDMRIGIDIGSTTAKVVVVVGGNVVYEKYQRHMSQVRQKTLEILRDARQHVHMDTVRVAVSGFSGTGDGPGRRTSFRTGGFCYW